jgi:hypothetical protein
MPNFAIWANPREIGLDLDGYFEMVLLEFLCNRAQMVIRPELEHINVT